MGKTIPRHRLIQSIGDMQPGEHAWVSHFSLKVNSRGQVLIELAGRVNCFEGSQPWPEHNKSGDYLVERTTAGFKLHLLKGDRVTVDHPSDWKDKSKRREWAKVTEVVERQDTCKACPQCHGRGVIEVEIPKETKPATAKSK